MDVVFVTGNEQKAKHFKLFFGLDIERHALDLDEPQSLDLSTIVEHKLTQAYTELKRPVLVEDVSLTFHALGKLPGPFIKWFLQEIGFKELCRLLDGKDRSATAACTYGYYNGKEMKFFSGSLKGQIASGPKGDFGFGWNQIFIPEGENKTLGEMTQEEFKVHYLKIKPMAEVAEYLNTI